MEERVPRVAIAPKAAGFLRDAVVDGGGEVVQLAEAAALVWTDHADPLGLEGVLDMHPKLEWVQLPWAGVDPYIELVRRHPERTWTCAKGVYSEPVAEHALALALAGRRSLGRFAQARTWTGQEAQYLLGAKVVIVGGGGITSSFLRLIRPFGCEVTVVRRTPEPLEGAARVVGPDALDEALAGADLVVLALPLLADTKGMIDLSRLSLLAPGACLVNVARGEHVVTDDLVKALDDGTLGSAGLDVTDPEPLPEGHPLWDRSNVIITPHTANTQEMAVPLLGRRVRENVERYAAAEPLSGYIDLAAGY